MWRKAALAAGFGLAACATLPQQPRSAGAYADFLIGRIANLQQDHAAAADRYFAALARSPRDETLLEGALAAALAAGDAARARQIVRAAPRTNASPYAHLTAAADALSAGRAAQADRALNGVEGAAAQELIGRMMRVWSRADSGHVDDALMDLAPLAAIRPYGGLFAYQQAMLLDYAGRGEQALAAYEAARQGGLWLPSAIERHADLLARRGAREAALTLLNADAERANPALAAARARLEGGGPVSLLPLTPARGAAIDLYGLAAIFLQESDSATALATLTLSNMLDPQFDSAWLSFAQTQIDLSHPELAQAALAHIGPDSAYAGSARILRAWILLRGGDEQGALSLLAADAAAGDARAERALGEMYRRLERYGEAAPVYSALIVREPGDWRLYFWRGASRERLGDWRGAEADLQQALVLSPEQPDVLNYLGYGWIDRGERLQEGLALLERAVALRPTSGAIVDSLGWAHYRLGDYAQALDQLERAVELDPADPTANDHLGDVYWRLGRRIEARFQWRRALTLAPDAPGPIEQKIQNGLPVEPARRSAAR